MSFNSSEIFMTSHESTVFKRFSLKQIFIQLRALMNFYSYSYFYNSTLIVFNSNFNFKKRECVTHITCKCSARFDFAIMYPSIINYV